MEVRNRFPYNKGIHIDMEIIRHRVVFFESDDVANSKHVISLVATSSELFKLQASQLAPASPRARTTTCKYLPLLAALRLKTMVSSIIYNVPGAMLIIDLRTSFSHLSESRLRNLRGRHTSIRSCL